MLTSKNSDRMLMNGSAIADTQKVTGGNRATGGNKGRVGGVGASHCLCEEYTASEIRTLLQELFPQRRLVLSQFTFFNQIGVAKPTGTTFRRRRRCYRLFDVLSIACVLQLKEEGIPLKNIEPVPGLVQEHAATIFAMGRGCRLSGCGSAVALQLPGESLGSAALDALLMTDRPTGLFWGFDIGRLAERLLAVAEEAVTAVDFKAPELSKLRRVA